LPESIDHRPHPRPLTFAGASIPGRGTPWGTLAEIAKTALEPMGYDIEIETRSFMFNNARFVADGRCDVGFMNLTQLLHAYFGEDAFEQDGPFGHLRLVALINHPTWLGVAAKAEAGIADLAQIAEERRPVKIRAANGGMVPLLLAHYGWDDDSLGEFGAVLLPTHDREGSVPVEPQIVEPDREAWAESGDFDLIIDTIYSGYTPEIHHWHEAAMYYDLEFLALPTDLVATITDQRLGTQGVLPRRLVRGLWYDVDAVQRLPQVIYCRDDLDDQVVLDLVRALDSNRNLFRISHLAFSYDQANVALSDVPLHAAAKRYYEAAGFPTT
jgi:TRAP-type uncharacterized transport system substrate-binding protein